MPEELPTFAGLQPRSLNRLRDPYWRMEIPVISTSHLPDRERRTVNEWSDVDKGVLYVSLDYWSIILCLEDGAEHQLGETTARDEVPVLAGIMEELGQRGFSHLRLDPDGMRFSDLPLFEDDEGAATGTEEH